MPKPGAHPVRRERPPAADEAGPSTRLHAVSTLADLCSGLPPEQLKGLIAALEQKALILKCGGELYAAVKEEWGYWLWRLEITSGEYAVTSDLSHCSCPSFDGTSCKHLTALRYGSMWNTDGGKKPKGMRGPR